MLFELCAFDTVKANIELDGCCSHTSKLAQRDSNYATLATVLSRNRMQFVKHTVPAAVQAYTKYNGQVLSALMDALQPNTGT